MMFSKPLLSLTLSAIAGSILAFAQDGKPPTLLYKIPAGPDCALKLTWSGQVVKTSETFCDYKPGLPIFPDVDNMYRMTIWSGLVEGASVPTPVYSQGYEWKKKYVTVFLDNWSCLRGSDESTLDLATFKNEVIGPCPPGTFPLPESKLLDTDLEPSTQSGLDSSPASDLESSLFTPEPNTGGNLNNLAFNTNPDSPSLWDDGFFTDSDPILSFDTGTTDGSLFSAASANGLGETSPLFVADGGSADNWQDAGYDTFVKRDRRIRRGGREG